MPVEEAMDTGSKCRRTMCPDGASHTSPIERHAREVDVTRDPNAVVQLALNGQRISAQGIALGTASHRIGVF
jgi:hypothetical protein